MDTTLNQLLSALGQQPANNDLTHAYGLKIGQVAWEDAARDKNSCVGPNISDMTLTVDDRRMPIIRKPNFSDVTCDLPLSDFSVTVGNETKDGELKRITLKEYLENLKIYNPETCASDQKSLLADRDEHVLASAQACVLPLGHGKDSDGKEITEVEFVPEIFNYQSTEDRPAVLVVVASSQGTSAAVLTRRAQKLYFNRGGQAVQFLAKRLSRDRFERGVQDKGDMTHEEQDRNLITVFQIPLKVPAVERHGQPIWYPTSCSNYYGPVILQSTMMCSSSTGYGVRGALSDGAARSFGATTIKGKIETLGGSDSEEADADSDEEMSFSMDLCASASAINGRGATKSPAKKKQSKGMENAMLRVSDITRGDYAGMKKKTLVRDERFPIRVTLQHYKVSDSQLLTEDDVKYIANKIKAVYEVAEASGSLVVGGDRAQARKTEITKTPVRPLPDLAGLSDKPLFAGKSRENEWCEVSA